MERRLNQGSEAQVVDGGAVLASCVGLEEQSRLNFPHINKMSSLEWTTFKTLLNSENLSMDSQNHELV